MDGFTLDRVTLDGESLDRLALDGESLDCLTVDRLTVDRFALDRYRLDGCRLDREPLDRESLDGCFMELPGLGIEDETGSAQPNHRIGLRVAPLIAAQLVLAATFALVAARSHDPIGSPVTIALFAGAFACAGAFNMRLEFRRHQFSFTLAEAVLSAAFFALGPIGIGIAAAVGEGASLAAQRVSPLKTVYNVGNRLA